MRTLATVFVASTFTLAIASASMDGSHWLSVALAAFAAGMLAGKFLTQLTTK